VTARRHVKYRSGIKTRGFTFEIIITRLRPVRETWRDIRGKTERLLFVAGASRCNATKFATYDLFRIPRARFAMAKLMGGCCFYFRGDLSGDPTSLVNTEVAPQRTKTRYARRAFTYRPRSRDSRFNARPSVKWRSRISRLVPFSNGTRTRRV